MIVEITGEAERDLEAIGDYIATDNPERALTFIAELRECCLTLAEWPNRFPLVPRYKHLGVRRRGYRHYLVFKSTFRPSWVIVIAPGSPLARRGARQGLVAPASNATLSSGLPGATAARRAKSGPLRRCSSVTMLWHRSLLTPCTGPDLTPSR